MRTMLMLLALGVAACEENPPTTDDLSVADMRGCVIDAFLRPVCGVDGKTYPNGEAADCAGVAIARQGACTDGG